VRREALRGGDFEEDADCVEGVGCADVGGFGLGGVVGDDTAGSEGDMVVWLLVSLGGAEDCSVGDGVALVGVGGGILERVSLSDFLLKACLSFFMLASLRRWMINGGVGICSMS
jgi:hypothetical protein